MNILGQKLASIRPAHTVCTPAAVCDDTAVCDHTFATGFGEVPRPDAPLVSALPFSEMEGVLYSLARILEQRDHHTAAHCERMAFSAVALGVAMELDSASLLLLGVGGYLHDIGKIGIPDSVLFKPGRLIGPEWEIMRTHPVRGEEICAPLKSLRGVLPLIRHHHERWDGSGYPDGLRGAGTPLLARVLQVVDIYDALTHPRPYKQAYTSAHALEILQQETGRGWRDPEITSLFVRVHEQMLVKIAEPPGSDAALGEIGDSLRNLHTHLTQ
jgi:response regulator RpfG family c-di-GMP phosphodiesterase